jgi:hypothetical protein
MFYFMNIQNPFAVSQIYSFVWVKYRPAVLRLMIDSTETPQQYKFSAHEIRRINPKEKGGYAFTLRMHKAKAMNDIRHSPIAKDFLYTLQESRKACELSDRSVYQFVLDKKFVLHVTHEVIEEAPSDTTQTTTVFSA